MKHFFQVTFYIMPVTVRAFLDVTCRKEFWSPTTAVSLSLPAGPYFREQNLCISMFLFLDPFTHTFLCTSSAFVSCLSTWLFFCHCSKGIHVYSRNQVIVYNFLGVWSYLYEENRADAGSLLQYTQPAKALQSSFIWTLCHALLIRSFNAWDHSL